MISSKIKNKLGYDGLWTVMDKQYLTQVSLDSALHGELCVILYRPLNQVLLPLFRNTNFLLDDTLEVE